MRDIILLNDNWRFYRNRDSADFEVVRLPHTNAEIPFNYFDEKCYQFASVYEKAFTLSSDYRGNLIFLTFEGAAHRAEVFINDKKVCIHNCGYTAFSVEISKEIKYGEENTIRVVLDSRENLNIPPFGSSGRLFDFTAREVVTWPTKKISSRSMNERRANRDRSPRRAALLPVRPAAANGPCVRRLTTT